MYAGNLALESKVPPVGCDLSSRCPHDHMLDGFRGSIFNTRYPPLGQQTHLTSVEASLAGAKFTRNSLSSLQTRSRLDRSLCGVRGAIRNHK